ncbi:MAG TPA: indole-3-glycerol phosphate synthase TrpC [Actinomycetota bacterium]|nr:indole-3-glycerol phosphate synthase TrpC [Actinomycetota bacterium]
MGFLSETVEEVRRRLEREPLDESGLMALAMRLPPTRGFVGALWSAAPVALVAEVKRASPSAGRIAEAEPAAQARAYEAAGAAAVSVLTEPRHFDGSLADLRAVHLATSLPVLRKDFLVHPAQLMEARVGGADAVLLIVAALSDPELAAMLAAADDLGLGALVEAHSERDLERALATPAKVIGVNARDLETLEVDVDRGQALLERVPADRIAVAESGISEREHVERAVAAGARAVLVGEVLMRADDPGAKLRELLGHDR